MRYERFLICFLHSFETWVLVSFAYPCRQIVPGRCFFSLTCVLIYWNMLPPNADSRTHKHAQNEFLKFNPRLKQRNDVLLAALVHWNIVFLKIRCVIYLYQFFKKYIFLSLCLVAPSYRSTLHFGLWICTLVTKHDPYLVKKYELKQIKYTLLRKSPVQLNWY